jgi:alpha-beta hydrolase superfamily lysophospholipase
MKRTGASSAYKYWDKNLPVLLISGGSDPVGDGGKGVERVKKAMDRAGIGDVTVKLWSGARHDLLHEETSGSAGQAREMITGWILSRVKG